MKVKITQIQEQHLKEAHILYNYYIVNSYANFEENELSFKDFYENYQKITGNKLPYIVAIDKEKVIFNNSIGDITAVDLNKGTLIWQTPTQNNSIYAESASLTTSDLVLEKDSIFFSNNRNEFYSINKDNGFLNWKQTVNSNIRPIITENIIFTVSNEGFLYVITKDNGNILRINDLYKNYKIKKRKKITSDWHK